MEQIADLLNRALEGRHDEGKLSEAVRREVKALCDRFPLWG